MTMHQPPSGSTDVNDDEYELTAEEAFSRLSPDERRRFGRMMKHEGRKRNVDFADVDDDDDDDDTKYDNPKKLARMARRSKKKDPGCSGACSRASAAEAAEVTAAASPTWRSPR